MAHFSKILNFKHPVTLHWCIYVTIEDREVNI